MTIVIIFITTINVITIKTIITMTIVATFTINKTINVIKAVAFPIAITINIALATARAISRYQLFIEIYMRTTLGTRGFFLRATRSFDTSTAEDTYTAKQR